MECNLATQCLITVMDTSLRVLLVSFGEVLFLRGSPMYQWNRACYIHQKRDMTS